MWIAFRKQKEINYPDLCKKLIDATFVGDWEYVRRNVAYDVEAYTYQPGQLGGVDGYIQMANGLLKRYSGCHPINLSCQYYLTTSGTPPIELYKATFDLTEPPADGRKNQEFELVMGFSRDGKLASIQWWASGQASLPEWLDETHLATPTCSGKVRRLIADVGETLRALRAVIIITTVLYILLILPSQSAEAFRVMASDQLFLSCLAFGFLSFFLTCTIAVVGHNALSSRPLWNRPDETVTTRRAIVEQSVMLLVSVALLATLVIAPIEASLDGSNSSSKLQYIALTCAVVGGISTFTFFVLFIVDDLRNGRRIQVSKRTPTPDELSLHWRAPLPAW